MPPLVSAIILNTWSGRKTVECVKALMKQSIAGEMEIIVVDNHSEDDSIGYIRNNLGSFPNVAIVETRRNLGFGGGYGAGLDHAKGRYILINNPEKIVEETGVRAMVDLMESDASIGIIGPKLLHDDGTVRLSPRSFPHPLDVIIKRTPLQHVFRKRMGRYLQLHLPQDRMHDVEWLSGGCMMIRADMMRQLEGFDSRFFLFFEDIDLCRRMREAGKRVVYAPKITARDRKRRLSDMSIFAMPFRKTGRAHIVSALKYFWKWRNGPIREESGLR